ncbi:MAG: hypothetical protein WC058_05425 [Phycisphaeraceae bacterium]
MLTRFTGIGTGFVIGLIGVLCFAATSFGAVPGAEVPLADRLPDDAIVYIGWVGSSKLGPGYEQSHTKALIGKSDLKALVTQVWPQLLAKIAQDAPEGAKQAGLVERLLEQVLAYPTAFYFGGMDAESHTPRLALICDAGDEAYAKPIADMLTQLIGRNIIWQVQQQGGRVIFRTAPVGPALTGALVSPLSANPAFAGALKQAHVTPGDPVVAVYVDVPKLMAVIEQMRPPGADAENWAKLRDAMRLTDLRQVMCTGGFDKGDWVTGMYVGITPPAPGTGGMVQMMRGKPLDESTLKLIPQSAAMAGAGRFDLTQLFDGLRTVVGQIDPENGRQFDATIKQFDTQLGMSIRDDVFGSLGDQWAWYTDRNVAGVGMLGMVAINPLRDPRKFGEALPKLTMMANMMMMAATQGQEFHFSIRTTEVDGVTLHYFALPAVAPTLAIKDGRMYLGLQPQTVVAAMRTAKAGGKSILDNAAFARLHRACGGQPIATFKFYDLPQTFGGGYQTMLLMTRIYLGFGDMFGVQTPAMMMPPVDQVLPHVAPAGVFTWSDETGIHLRGRSPFPGASLLGTDQNLMVSQYAMSLGILLPALERAREAANRAVSAANERGIYKACYIYSVSHNDAFPTDLAELIADGSISAKSLLHPNDSHRTRTFPQVKLTDPKVSEWARNNMSYIYLGGSANMAADDIVIYEKPDPRWAREGITIGFGDGHVSWTAWSQVPEVFKQAGKTPPTPPGSAKMSDRSSSSAGAGSAGSGQAWYYDTKTGEYFKSAADQFSPITSAKGNPAVRAHFFSCGSCDSEKDRFAGFYDKYTDEAKAKFEAARNAKDPQQLANVEMYSEIGVLYSIDGQNWYPPSSEEYQEALQKKLNCPNGGRAKYCRVKR